MNHYISSLLKEHYILYSLVSESAEHTKLRQVYNRHRPERPLSFVYVLCMFCVRFVYVLCTYCVRFVYVLRLSCKTTHLEMESYGISNKRKDQTFLDFFSVVISEGQRF